MNPSPSFVILKQIELLGDSHERWLLPTTIVAMLFMLKEVKETAASEKLKQYLKFRCKIYYVLMIL